MADGTLYVGEHFVMAILVGCCCGKDARCERFTLFEPTDQGFEWENADSSN